MGKNVCKAERAEHLHRLQPREYHEFGPLAKGFPRAAFGRLVKDILETQNKELGLRMEARALGILHEFSEDWLVSCFEDANCLATHATDLILAQKLRRGN